VQIVCNLGPLKEQGASSEEWTTFRHIVRRGDWFGEWSKSMTWLVNGLSDCWLEAIGYTHKTASGEPSLLVTQIPKLQAPSLHQIPQKLDDAGVKARRPHVAMLVDRKAIQTIQMRSHIETWLASHLQSLGFHKVSTPLLTAGSGGAVARPFETVATELQDTKLNLRIAPELWLKRLMVGGMGKVYEMGPAFRNEGSSDFMLLHSSC